MLSTRQEILKVLKELSLSENPGYVFGSPWVREKVNRARNSIGRTLANLVEEGLLEKPNKNSYVLTQYGRDELAKIPSSSQ